MISPALKERARNLGGEDKEKLLSYPLPPTSPPSHFLPFPHPTTHNSIFFVWRMKTPPSVLHG